MIAFIGWTGFSFLCHWSSKRFLANVQTTWRGPLVGIIASVILTTCQIIACLGNLKVKARKKEESDDQKKHTDSHGAIYWAFLAHTLASLATNYSLAMMEASHTLMIKLMEPIMSAFILWGTMGKAVTCHTLLSLFLVVISAMGFVNNWNGSSYTGTILALISNLLYGVRNVTVKHVLGGTAIQLCDLFDYVIPNTIVFAVFSQLFYQADDIFSLKAHIFPIAFALSSAICHVLYSYISTSVVLEYMSVVGHAVANIGKRVLVVLLLMLWGDRVFSPTAFIWLALATVGLAIYSRDKVLSTGTGATENSKL